MTIAKNRCKVAATGGDSTTDFVLGTPIPSFVGFANGDTVYAVIAETDEWQIGLGTVASNTLSRGTVQANHLGTTNQIDFTGLKLQIAQVVSAASMNAITDKLDLIEDRATADQTGAEIKVAYEAELDTNAFNDAAKSKLSGIEFNATADQNASEVPFTPTTTIPYNNVQDAIERVQLWVENHNQAASTITYDPTEDSTSDDIDVQAALVDHGQSIEQRVASCTGLISGGKISIAGTDTFTIAAGIGEFLDSYTNPKNTSIIEQSWAEIPAASIYPEIGTLTIGSIKVFLNTSAGVAGVIKITGDVINSIYRDHIFLGTVYVMGGIIVDVISAPVVVKQTSTDTIDLLKQNISLTGGELYPVDTVLSFWQDAGELFMPGSNWHDQDHKNPNFFAFSATSDEPRQPVLFSTITQDGGINATDISVVPKYYDNAGTITLIPAGKATAHRIYLLGYTDGSRKFVLQYGQVLYDTADEARDNLVVETYVSPEEADNMYLMGYTGISESATDYSNSTLAWIMSIQEGQGQAGGGGGSSLDHNKAFNRALVDQHPITSIGDTTPEGQLTAALASKMHWAGEWFPGTYEANDVVKDNDWTMVANKQTSDTAAPQVVGDPNYHYTGTLSDNSVSAKQVIFGGSYTWPDEPGWITGWRIQIVAGNKYIVYSVKDPDGADIIEEMMNFTAASSDWVEFTIAPTIVTLGTKFDLIVVVSEPDPAPTTFTANYTLTCPKKIEVPETGTICQPDDDPEYFRIDKTDADSNDLTTELGALNTGDIIDSGLTRYSIQSINDGGSYVEFIVTPTSQDDEDLRNYTFETVAAVPITYGREVDGYLADSNVKGLFGVDTPYADIVPDDNAYGIDIMIQNAVISDDWDVLATSSGGNASSSGDGTDAVWGLIEGTLSAQTDLQTELDGKEPIVGPKNTAFNKNFGTTALTVCDGNDARLSNARTPLSHTHIKSEVGLSNVNNTSDLAKPISTATQAALDNKEPANAALVPHLTDYNDPHNVTKAQVSLSYVDNTSDANKPISIATQTALNDKVEEAPIDGKLYGRQNGQWVEIVSGGVPPVDDTNFVVDNGVYVTDNGVQVIDTSGA